MDNLNEQTNEVRTQVFSICRKLVTMVPPLSLSGPKADATIRYWLPEVPIGLISKYKVEFLRKSKL